MQQRGKNKNYKKEIKDWLVAIGICLGLLLMGGEGENLSSIWVNFLGLGLLIVSAVLGGASSKVKEN